ncbi:fatty acid elongase, 5 TM, GNS1/SUR4 membrane protein [Trichoderma guizhouense]|uniref:Elongation of fatty acids protein n=1 Tax=Trichoderma guizhouense TaxID=1491466 RepID=A0A1T3CD11_9HYPO|nr:fatty acid elongase, 5 TM, GNS1/SUR4 membrane protein [Trichoderma guizhouense]
MSKLQIWASWPEAHLFNFPPANPPAPIPPAHVPATILRPFNIPDDLYVSALDARVPLTIAALYAISAKLLNKYNKARNKKPWGISKTRPFFVFVVLHNIFLAVYSAWTFWGMVGVMQRSFVSPFGPGGVAATADGFCRPHGPRGLGNSIYFNETTLSWDSASPSSVAHLLASNGMPSTTEPGRMWNEGLNFYGWIFYLSKFYEVLDTFIILAKGKYSSTLQTYHHAGAMMCMWAGMRYMAIPIWIFCLFNSFIHSLMYTYYTLSAFSVRVPTALKRSLTSMQITQFIIGATFAMVPSFVTYVSPITSTHVVTEESPVTRSAPIDYIIPTAVSALDSLKQLIFGSAEVAGAAEAAAAPTMSKSTTVTRRFDLVQPCTLTTGETFAIWINVVYLAPLTYLFISFFIASYVKRSSAAQKLGGKAARGMSDEVTLAEKAGWEAARNVEREVYGGEQMAEGSSSPNGKTKRRA